MVETREPGGSAGAEAIRGLLLHDHHWTPEAEALLFAAARADHVARTIRPALERGAWVLCDRFLDSSIAYQGGAGGLGLSDAIRLHQIGSLGLLPDRTLLLQLPDAGSDRAAAGKQPRHRRRRPDRRPRRRLSSRASPRPSPGSRPRSPDRYRVIDASGAAEEVTERLLAALEDLL